MFDKIMKIPSNLEKIIEFKTAGMTPPNKIIFGFKAVDRIGTEAKKYGQQVMLVSDDTMQKIGVVDSIAAILKASNLQVEIFASVEPEPHIETAEKLYDQCLKSSSTVMIGLGGGSVMDIAKLAAQAVGEKRRPLEYADDSVKPAQRGLPLILVPTTSGTGSEVSPYQVMKIGEKKKFFLDDFYYPDMAIIDPLLTVSMPPSVTASTGIDALSHAIEGIMHKNASDFTYTFGKAAIEMIGKFMRRAVADGEDLEARYYMSMAASLAMIAMSTSGGLFAHSVSFVLAKYNPTPHGVGCGLGLPYLMDFNRPVIKEKLVKIAAAFGEKIWMQSDEYAAKQSVYAVANLMHDCNLPVALKDCAGFREADLGDMAALMLRDYPRPMNPRQMAIKHAEEYWRNMWFGKI